MKATVQQKNTQHTWLKVLVGKVDLHSIRLLLSLYIICTLITIIIAYYFGAPFVFLFKHVGEALLSVLFYIGFLGIAWDGLLIYLGLIFKFWLRWISYNKGVSQILSTTKKIRFFSRGVFALILILISSFIIYGTGNITLISLQLIGSTTEWRDSFFWAIEEPAFRWITNLPIDVGAWDMLYHSAWPIELFAVFVLILMGRNLKIVLSYCVSMILLFYVGRFLGVLNPVMGPAFFKPELFTYLSGSVTEIVMQSVADIMAIEPEQAKERSGILLGGVSAMPSLHLGMVTLTSFWLALEKRATLFITIPWVLLVWISTIVLGWHYIMDGAGGILLGLICVWLTQRLLQFIKLEFST